MPLYPDETLFPAETLYPDEAPGGAPVGPFVFNTPVAEVFFPMIPKNKRAHFFGKENLGVNVYRIAGVWHTSMNLTPDQETAADRLYRGGYTYTLTQAKYDELVAAGYSDFITTGGS